MTIAFAEQEEEWLEQEPYNEHVKEGCPEDIRKTLEAKLERLRPESEEILLEMRGMRRHYGPTPCGGAYSDIWLLDHDHNVVMYEECAGIEIHEYSKTGDLLMATHGMIEPDVK
ncbi:MAG: hypothetical protein K5770_15460 [Lachnospiraceae bacterium]|nr:hypothetical protein [Lachnospiraceae bacterium]